MILITKFQEKHREREKERGGGLCEKWRFENNGLKNCWCYLLHFSMKHMDVTHQHPANSSYYDLEEINEKNS